VLENTPAPLDALRPVLESSGVADKPVAVPFTETVDPEGRLVMLKDVICAFKLPTPPTTTANSPTHFPSLKTGPAIFQTWRRGRRFGILDVGCWMLDVE
jgi:hypothetical protein